jgi:uncharacterized protein (DUF433 family)
VSERIIRSGSHATVRGTNHSADAIVAALRGGILYENLPALFPGITPADINAAINYVCDCEDQAAGVVPGIAFIGV